MRIYYWCVCKPERYVSKLSLVYSRLRINVPFTQLSLEICRCKHPERIHKQNSRLDSCQHLHCSCIKNKWKLAFCRLHMNEHFYNGSFSWSEWVLCKFFFSRDVFGYAAKCIKRTFDINNICYSYFDQRENNLVVIRILTKRNLKLST